MSKQLSQEKAQQAPDLNALFTQILLDNKDITAIITQLLGIPFLHNLALTSTKAYWIYIKLIQFCILDPPKRVLVAYLTLRHLFRNVPHPLTARLRNRAAFHTNPPNISTFIDVTPEDAHTFLIQHEIETEFL